MKNKQKVWIRGVEGRGDEVLNALKAVGGKLTHCSRLSGEDDTCIYSITHKGFLCVIPAVFPMGGIVIDGKEHLQMMEIQFTFFFLNFLMSPITFYIRTKWDNVSPFND